MRYDVAKKGRGSMAVDNKKVFNSKQFELLKTEPDDALD